jgi:hypothetical protein
MAEKSSIPDWERPESYHLGWQKNKAGLKPVALAVVLISSISGLFSMFEDGRPVGAFFEQFVATVLWIVLAFAPIWLAAWIGAVVYEKIGSKIIGWLAGITTYFAIVTCSMLLVQQIPGVGWRFDLIRNSGDD